MASGPDASVLKRASVFVAIGAVLFVLFDQFGPYQSGRGYKLRPIERVGDGGVVSLDRGRDGHFYVSGRIGGRGHEEAVAFMVDTGASTVAIGDALAGKLDLGPCQPRRYQTAAGTVDGCEAVASFVELAGLRIPDVRIAVLPDNDVVLLGMRVLRHFRIEQQGRRMVLTPLP